MEHHFVICIRNEDYPASLEIRKIYLRLTDPEAEAQQLFRIIDESGEDYLYPASFFLPLELSQESARVVLAAGLPGKHTQTVPC